MKKQLGGNSRVGSGGKMDIKMHGFQTTTHDLSKAIRTTCAPGILYPVLCEPTLPGDSFHIDINTLIKTVPAVNPVYGGFKWQVEIYKAKNKLYIKDEHNNKRRLGLKMNTVYLPQMKISAPNPDKSIAEINGQKINKSSILPYLGIRGLGTFLGQTAGAGQRVVRTFPANFLLMYNEVYRDFYANLQENEGVVVTGTAAAENARATQAIINSSVYKNMAPVNNPTIDTENIGWIKSISTAPDNFTLGVEMGAREGIVIAQFGGDNLTVEGLQVYCDPDNGANKNIGVSGWVRLIDLISAMNSRIREQGDETTTMVVDYTPTDVRVMLSRRTQGVALMATLIKDPEGDFIARHPIAGINAQTMVLERFPLEDIDTKRDQLLSAPSGVPFVINETNVGNLMPYRKQIGIVNGTDDPQLFPQAGLLVKTHQSDRFNNWLDSETISGEDGITELSRVAVVDGAFSIDAFNFATRVWKSYNRIAAGGGRYSDWIEEQYDESFKGDCLAPELVGAYSGEIEFDEIVSTAQTEADGKNNVLGSLAGRGMSKGGRGVKTRISFKGEGTGMIMAIFSITPRVDYSQGNKWWNTGSILTEDDFYKPLFGGIGFQDLITEEMAAWDTKIDGSDNSVIQYSAGKQPYAIQYMTNQNELYGDLANKESLSSWVITREYEHDEDVRIKDLTTYVDPTKYNTPFADQGLDALNFIVQIGMGISAKRKMSGKIIPNL